MTNPYTPPTPEDAEPPAPLPERHWIWLAWGAPLVGIAGSMFLNSLPPSADPFVETVFSLFRLCVFLLGIVVGLAVSVASLLQIGKLKSAAKHGVIGLTVNLLLVAAMVGSIFALQSIRDAAEQVQQQNEKQ